MQIEYLEDVPCVIRQLYYSLNFFKQIDTVNDSAHKVD